MKLGFIGAGQVSLAIAKKSIAAGHEAMLSSRRGATHIAERVAELGPQARAVSVKQAASADIVFLAVPWQDVETALSDLPAWHNRILIDTTNPFIASSPKLLMADLGGRSSSAVVADYVPGARVVKAFNSILMSNFDKSADQDGIRRMLFLSGDDTEAKQIVRGLIEAFGYAVIDLGGLDTGGRMQQGGGPLAGQDLLLFADWRPSMG